MKPSKFIDGQILDAVKRVEVGLGVPGICRELGISTAIFSNGLQSMAAFMSP